MLDPNAQDEPREDTLNFVPSTSKKVELEGSQQKSYIVQAAPAVHSTSHPMCTEGKAERGSS
jgi:hypothetical protein